MEANHLSSEQDAFLLRYNNLLRTRQLADALTLADERLKQLYRADNEMPPKEALLEAINLIDDSTDLLNNLQSKLLDLGQVLDSLNDNRIFIDRQCPAPGSEGEFTEKIMNTLSVWLENISRIKTYAGHI